MSGAEAFLVFVLTAGQPTIDADRVAAAYARLMPDAPRLVVAERRGSDAIWDVNGTGQSLIAAVMPAPVPNGEADEAARYSASAIGGGWKMPAHTSHVTVVMHGQATRPHLQALTQFTAMVAALVSSVDAVGVYWGAAGVTHEPKFFAGIAADAQAGPPTMVWTGLSLARQGNRVSLLSTGMEAMTGLPDLLLTAPRQQANDALGFFYDLLGYVVRGGTALPEGHAVGRTAEEKLHIRYVPSPVDATRKVMSVDWK
jgi:hypothetical protein